MKKHIVLAFLVASFCIAKCKAQGIHIPNSSFEVWHNLGGLIDVPDSWPSSDLLWYDEGYDTRNVYSDAHSHSGQYSARIGPDTSSGEIWPGFIAASFPIHQRAKYFSMYYVDSLNKAETGTVQISIFKWNTTTQTDDSIGGATWDFPDSTVASFAYTEIPITYSNDDTTLPDSASINIEVVSAATSLPSGHVAVDDIELSVQKPASVKISALTDAFTVSPNPSNGTMKLALQNQFHNPFLLYVCDINGKIIYSKHLNNEAQTQIDLSEYPSGVYIMKILSDDGISIKKIIINR